jgi:N-acetylglucosamine-6-phosphate deacetylase
MTRFALTANRVFDGERMLAETAVVIEEGRITSVGSRREIASGDILQDLGDGLLAPGFVDVQVNGGGGVLLNDTPTPAGVRAIAEAHARFGTVALLPTAITDRPEVTRAAASAVSAAIGDGVPGVLGIHIEGPFIDVSRKGAHALEFIRKPAQADIDWPCGLKCGRVLVTVSPNQVLPDQIRQLAGAGVIVNLGHSDASCETAQAALAAGARGFTHLFNAMSQLTGREPGMVGAALAADAHCGLIADGHHVHPAALRVAIAAKPRGRCHFISDAMPSAAGGPASFALQGRTVSVVNGRLQLVDGTLAGATITMLDAVRYGCGSLGLTLEESLRMASLYPAAFLNLDHELGRIVPGQRASLVHLGDRLDMLGCWQDGKRIAA